MSPIRTYKFSDFAHGVIVFWVDETGHGLDCSLVDISAGIRWNADCDVLIRSESNGPLAGIMNTLLILAIQGNGNGDDFAARICY